MDSSSYLCSLLSKSKSRCHYSTEQQGSEPCNLRIPHKVKEVKHEKACQVTLLPGKAQKRQADEDGKRSRVHLSQAGGHQLTAGGKKGSVGE